MSDRRAPVHYSASLRSLSDLDPRPQAAETAYRLAAGPSLLLALLLSLGLWGAIWWVVSAIIAIWPS
jgi:hypothetical protein